MKNILIVMMLLCGIPSYAQYYVIHAWAPHKSDNPLFECNWYPDETVEGTSLTCFFFGDNNDKFLTNFVDFEYEDGTKCLFFPDKLNDIVVKGEPYIVYAPVRKPVEDLLSLSGTTRALFSNNKCSIDVCYNDEGMVYRSSMEFEYEIFDVNFNNINSYLCIDDIIQINYNAPLPCQSVIEYSIDNGLSYSFFKIVPANVSFATITWDEVKDRNINTSFKVRIKYELDGVDYYASKTQRIPEFYPYYPLDEKELYVINDSLHIPLNTTYKDDGISVNSYFEQVGNKTFQGRELNKDGYLDYNFKGPYRLTFNRTNYCSVERYVFVPEVKYNKVNGSDNEFWYENEKRNAVTLEYKYPQDCTEELIFNHNTNVPKEITSKERNDGKIVVSGHKNNNELDTLDCNVSIFDFETDKNLNKIDVTITSDKNKQFVPVHINLKELKSYPNIAAVDRVVIEQPHCNYSDAILTFPELKGGLSNGYFYQINNEKTLQIPDSKKIVLDDKLQSFSLKIFDNTENIDTIGRIARSLDLGKIDINRPQSIEFLDTVSTNLSCYHDNSGAFEIKDVQLTYPDKPVMYNWYKYPYNEIDKLTAKESFAKGLAAGNYIVEVENNGCKDTAYFTLSEPEFPLEISKDTVKNPVCFGYSNGRIITHTTGGTQPYTYSWNNGSQDTAIYNLKTGTYILSVTDSHGCKDTATQELVDPEELQNSLTPSHTICKNGELKIDEGDLKSEDLHYFWRLPNEMIHNERVLVVNSDMPEGDYIMVTQDSKECFTKDTTNIKFSDNELEIKFLAPTYSYLGDTVVLAEDSEIFTDYTWSYQFNNDMFEDITSSMYNTPKNQTFLLSLTSGSDTITMYANDGKCNASYSKVVNILNEQRSDYSNYEAPSAGIFTRLAIGPSPNDGNFTLYANLTEEAALDVFILDLQTALKIPLKYDFKFVSDHYAIPVHGLNLLKGVYALFVTANGDTKYVKFTIK